MSKHWEAPRIAYELAAEWAQQHQDLAARRGGADGQDLPAYVAISKAWHDLRLVARRDVLDALGGQARAAMWEVHEQLARAGTQVQIQIVDQNGYADRLCEQARGALAVLSSPDRGRTEWKMPECSHCQMIVAELLIALQWAAINATGADPAVVLRTMAEQVQVPPDQRRG